MLQEEWRDEQMALEHDVGRAWATLQLLHVPNGDWKEQSPPNARSGVNNTTLSFSISISISIDIDINIAHFQA